MDLMLVYRAYANATPSRKPSTRRSLLNAFFAWLLERNAPKIEKKPQLMKKVGNEVLPFFER